MREAAARMSCSNNLKQISLGMANHESARGYFPGLSDGAPNTLPAGMTTAHYAFGLLANLLPYLEQGSLQKLINFSQPATISGWSGDINPIHDPASSSQIKMFLCSSDGGNPFLPNQKQHAHPMRLPLRELIMCSTWVRVRRLQRR